MQPKVNNIYIGKLLSIMPRCFQSHLTFYERLRLKFRSIKKYYLYYVMDGSGTLISYCFVKRNYAHRYSFVSNRDLMITPYYTAPSKRGQGYAQYLLSHVVNDYSLPYHHLFAVVNRNNIPSIKCVEAVGFKRVGYSEVATGPISDNNELNWIVFQIEAPIHRGSNDVD